MSKEKGLETVREYLLLQCYWLFLAPGWRPASSRNHPFHLVLTSILALQASSILSSGPYRWGAVGSLKLCKSNHQLFWQHKNERLSVLFRYEVTNQSCTTEPFLFFDKKSEKNLKKIQVINWKKKIHVCRTWSFSEVWNGPWFLKTLIFRNQGRMSPI